MKIIVSSSELLKGTMTVAKAIPSKAPNPILENFLFVVQGNLLQITASDTEITMRTSIEVENVEEEGQIAIPAKHLMDLLKELPDQPLTIQTVSETAFEFSWASGKSILPYFPAVDYPAIATTNETAITLDFPAQELMEGISSTIYATADDEIRPTMNGIFFDIEEESTTLVASDAHKLICYTAQGVKASEKSSFILHKKPAGILRSIIGKGTETVKIAFDAKNVVFQFDSTIAICRIIVGKYPRYRDVIPQSNSNIMKISRLQLLNSVKRVAVCANKGSNHIKFTLSENQLEITAQDLGFSLEAYEKQPCEYAGDSLSIGFKSTFLIEILSNIDCEEIIMKFADGARPAVIIPSEEEETGGKICGILMPSIA